jgi:hypothetical protein
MTVLAPNADPPQAIALNRAGASVSRAVGTFGPWAVGAAPCLRKTTHRIGVQSRNMGGRRLA